MDTNLLRTALQSETHFISERETFKGYCFSYRKGTWKSTETFSLYFLADHQDLHIIYMKINRFSENIIVEQTISHQKELDSRVPFWVRKIVHISCKHIKNKDSLFLRERKLH